MSTAAGDAPSGAASRLFIELAHRLDDEAAPSELTVYPPGVANLTTSWITADLAHVVALEDAR